MDESRAFTKWIIGRTNFNADLFEAEHLMIADEVPFTDLASRRVFGSKIKDITVNSIQTCHGKFANAIHLMPCWRLTISLNEESENLQMLPPLDTSLRDKIMLFKIKKAKILLPCNSPQERKEFWEELKKELPAFIQFLQNWEILVGEKFDFGAIFDVSISIFRKNRSKIDIGILKSGSEPPGAILGFTKSSPQNPKP